MLDAAADGAERALWDLCLVEENSKATATALRQLHPTRRRLSQEWRDPEVRMRSRALDQWMDIAELAGENSALVCRARAEQRADEGPSWRRSVEDAISSRATSTLAKRASALLMYVRWARSTTGSALNAFPFRESFVYAYTCFLRDVSAPATRAKSFVEAAVLAGALLEIDGGIQLSKSHRIRGGGNSSFARKRLLKKARALAKHELQAFEVAAFEAASRCTNTSQPSSASWFIREPDSRMQLG